MPVNFCIPDTEVTKFYKLSGLSVVNFRSGETPRQAQLHESKIEVIG